MQYKHGKNVKSLGYNHKPKFYSVIQYLFPHKKKKTETFWNRVRNALNAWSVYLVNTDQLYWLKEVDF